MTVVVDSVWVTVVGVVTVLVRVVGVGDCVVVTVVVERSGEVVDVEEVAVAALAVVVF
jgi:hypothetical protein